MTTNIVTAEPIPLSDPIAHAERPEFAERRRAGDRSARDPLAGFITTPWQNWFTNLLRVLGAVPTSLRTVSKTAQDASIGATDIVGGTLKAGLYRLSYYARITQAASTSSSLTVTLDWTDTVVPSFSGAAITGNTTTTVQSGSLLIRVTAAPVRYSTAYVSVGGTPMKYALDVVLEQISA